MIINFIVGIILIVLGLAIVGYSIFTTRQAKLIKTDPKYQTTNTGEILISEIDQRSTGSSSNQAYTFFTTFNFQYAYKPLLVYKYTVNNVLFENDNVYYGGPKYSPNKIKALKYNNKYPKGKKVNVIYNVNDPSESYLEYPPTNNYRTFFAILSCALLVMTGALFITKKLNFGNFTFKPRFSTVYSPMPNLSFGLTL